MVVAITSLTAYWFGVQSVIESRNNPMYGDALRIAESLLSPGSPSNWTALSDMNGIKQIGIAKDFGNELDRMKIDRLQTLANPSVNSSNYIKVGKIMRATGDYYIVVEQTDDKSVPAFKIGRAPPANATEVVVAHRGAMLADSNGRLMPMRIQVFLWRQ